MRIAVYPGSFDPVTNGHIDVAMRALRVFDEVVIAVIENPEKKAAFSIADRMKMIRESVKGINGKVKVGSFRGLLVDYVKKMKACAIVRGLRAVSDFDYEFQMAGTNHRLYPDVSSVFLMTDSKFSYVSSSLVKQIARLGGDVGEFVPVGVRKRLMGLYQKKRG